MAALNNKFFIAVKYFVNNKFHTDVKQQKDNLTYYMLTYITRQTGNRRSIVRTPGNNHYALNPHTCQSQIYKLRVYVRT